MNKARRGAGDLARPSCQGSSTLPMNPLRRMCMAFIQLIKQARLLPRSVTEAAEQRRRQVVLNEHEAERLDRIRNPSKYLGK